MKTSFDYTTSARNFALKHPRLNFILIQTNFWIAAYLVLAIILYLNTKAITLAYNLDISVSIVPGIVVAIIAGLFFGIMLGFADGLIEKHYKKGVCLGRMIFYQGLIYFIVLLTLKVITRFILWEYLILPIFFNNISPISEHVLWSYYSYILVTYTFTMALVISFINQMNKKFGPGILVPMLLGKYRTPKEEERIFMFMDLQSSTTHAENLGHIEYSAMIRDCFIDINSVLSRHLAEVYQYVGDEIVVSWPLNEGLNKLTCVKFYFDCQEQFNLRSNYYLKKYGFIPKFKAGLHEGLVTAVEVGEVKRDIAYHGDTLNTASRIQAKCNEYESDLLVSDLLESKISWTDKFTKRFVGSVLLRGKSNPVDLYSIQPLVA